MVYFTQFCVWVIDMRCLLGAYIVLSFATVLFFIEDLNARDIRTEGYLFASGGLQFNSSFPADASDVEVSLDVQSHSNNDDNVNSINNVVSTTSGITGSPDGGAAYKKWDYNYGHVAGIGGGFVVGFFGMELEALSTKIEPKFGFDDLLFTYSGFTINDDARLKDDFATRMRQYRTALVDITSTQSTTPWSTLESMPIGGSGSGTATYGDLFIDGVASNGNLFNDLSDDYISLSSQSDMDALIDQTNGVFVNSSKFGDPTSTASYNNLLAQADRDAINDLRDLVIDIDDNHAKFANRSDDISAGKFFLGNGKGTWLSSAVVNVFGFVKINEFMSCRVGAGYGYGSMRMFGKYFNTSIIQYKVAGDLEVSSDLSVFIEYRHVKPNIDTFDDIKFIGGRFLQKSIVSHGEGSVGGKDAKINGFVKGVLNELKYAYEVKAWSAGVRYRF